MFPYGVLWKVFFSGATTRKKTGRQSLVVARWDKIATIFCLLQITDTDMTNRFHVTLKLLPLFQRTPFLKYGNIERLKIDATSKCFVKSRKEQ